MTALMFNLETAIESSLLFGCPIITNASKIVVLTFL